MRISIEGVETNYQDMGKGEVLVLLHGWGCDWQIWAPLIPELSKRYRLILPDLPAFGNSAVPKEVWDSTQYVTWLNTLLEELDIRSQILLMGHSFGGKIAALFAAKHNSRVKKLILCDASGVPDPLTTRQQLQQTLLSLVPPGLKTLLPTKLRLHILNKLGASTDHLQSTPQQKAILRQIVRENIREKVSSIKALTLLLWGELDQDTPLHQAHVFAERINGAELVVMENVGHFPFLEKPREFLAIVSDFLS